MRRFTTPSVPIVVHGADLRHCRVWVTLSQDGLHRLTREVTGIKERVDRTTWRFGVRLTQDETATFRDGAPIRAQVNLMDQNGFRAATDIEEIIIENINLMDWSVK